MVAMARPGTVRGPCSEWDRWVIASVDHHTLDVRPLVTLPAKVSLRRRSHNQDELSLDCRMAASVSDEAVAATHVAMALETVALLAEEMSADDAIMHYVRYFSLPSVEAQIIFRRTLAAWADRHPVREPLGTTDSVCAAAPAVPFTHRVPLTLRIAG